MHAPNNRTRIAGVLATAVTAVAAAVGFPAGSAVAGTARVWAEVRASPAEANGEYTAVTAVSPADVWAVGCAGYDCQYPRVARWNGRDWRLHSLDRAVHAYDFLYGIAATSARDVWAVGTSAANKPLILHWNGVAWRRMPGLGRTEGNLFGVAAVSACDVWAVGDNGDGNGNPFNTTLIVHWNGRTWRRVPSPSPGPGGVTLWAVAGATARDVWAVGAGGKTGILIEHWNGRAWRQVQAPGPASSALFSLTVASARDVWAVGTARFDGPLVGTLVEHWNGTAWRRVPSPSPPLYCADDVNFLSGVAVTSAREAWAVGTDGSMCAQSYFERWNGTTWKIAHVGISAPGGWTLTAMAATTPRSIWAVGNTGFFEPLIVYWNGRTWRQVHGPAF